MWGPWSWALAAPNVRAPIWQQEVTTVHLASDSQGSAHLLESRLVRATACLLARPMQLTCLEVCGMQAAEATAQAACGRRTTYAHSMQPAARLLSPRS